MRPQRGDFNGVAVSAPCGPAPAASARRTCGGRAAAGCPVGVEPGWVSRAVPGALGLYVRRWRRWATTGVGAAMIEVQGNWRRTVRGPSRGVFGVRILTVAEIGRTSWVSARSDNTRLCQAAGCTPGGAAARPPGTWPAGADPNPVFVMETVIREEPASRARSLRSRGAPGRQRFESARQPLVEDWKPWFG